MTKDTTPQQSSTTRDVSPYFFFTRGGKGENDTRQHCQHTTHVLEASSAALISLPSWAHCHLCYSGYEDRKNQVNDTHAHRYRRFRFHQMGSLACMSACACPFLSFYRLEYVSGLLHGSSICIQSSRALQAPSTDHQANAAVDSRKCSASGLAVGDG